MIGAARENPIAIPRIRGWLEPQGFAGCCEVEIFSVGNWWQRETQETLGTCIQRHRNMV